MDIETLQAFLWWCAGINIALLLYWWAMFSLCHDFVYKMHSKWFKIDVERFDAIHYAGMTYFKITLFVFNLVPAIALMIAAD
ncbi:MAG: DUF6868 family protein [Planctomycetota bacterium]